MSENSKPNATIASHADLARLDPELVVVKLGSNVVTTDVGHLDDKVLDEVADFAARRAEDGRPTLVVSSGAVAAGIGKLGLNARPKDLPELQALAAVGQTRLMDSWARAFARHGRDVAQVLVSAEDFRDRRRYLNMRYTFEKLFALGVVPVVNENDTITIDELRFGDNDGLAQMIAIKMMADLLVFLTSVGGLYRNVDRQGAGDLVEVVEKITPDILGLASGETSARGSGGMAGKLEAAATAARAGIPVLIAPGKKPGALERVVSGGGGATLVVPEKGRRYNRRQRFIAFSRLKPRGRLHVDDGAARALVSGKKSLLPAGIVRTEGDYERGFVVDVVAPDGTAIARGLVNYDAHEIDRIKGRKTSEIESILGRRDYDEAIHRDNLVVLQEDGSQ